MRKTEGLEIWLDKPTNEYAAMIWDYDTSPYIEERRLTGHNLSKGYCKNMARIARKHLSKYLAAYTLQTISAKPINNMLLELRCKYAAETVNGIRNAICIPILYASRQGYGQNIQKSILHFAGEKKKRGILSAAETTAVFDFRWGNKKSYLANLLASKTGMRIGEIQALGKKDICSRTIGGKETYYLSVQKSYSQDEGLKNTKTSRSRSIPIDAAMRNALLELANQAANNPYIFAGRFADRPMDKKTISRYYYEALVRIGIDAPERRRRNIVTHSWRHYVAARLAATTDIYTAMSITGHATYAIFAAYAEHDNDKLYAAKQAALDAVNDLRSAGNSAAR